MSNICIICNKSFKFPYLLHRHLNKKLKCKQSIKINSQVEEKVYELEQKLDKQKEELEQQREQLIEHKELLQEQSYKIHSFENNNFENNNFQKGKENAYRCKYCNKLFSFESNLQRHLRQKSCKLKNDNVSIYERELGIKPPDISSLTCRFCLVSFSKQQSYSRHINSDCKEKLKYEIELQKKIQQNRKNISESISFNGNQNKNNSDNTTTNNNTFNNIYLPQMNAFGKENLDYITTKMLVKQIELCKDFSDITETVKTFTQLIHAHPAHPENHNVLIKGNNSAFSEIFNGENMEQVNSTGVQDKILHTVGKLLLDKKSEYCEEQDKKEKKISKKIETKLMKLEEAVDDNINSELFKDNVAESSRNLTAYRNTIKGALVSNKDDIQQIQKITCS